MNTPQSKVAELYLRRRARGQAPAGVNWTAREARDLRTAVADNLYLSVWFPSFEGEQMLDRLACVAQHFPFSAERPGITYLAVRPISWNEPTVFERRFEPGIAPADALETARDFLHEDYAYEIEAWWDLWSPDERGTWSRLPRRVRLIAHGAEFDDAAFEQEGHVEVDFGIDTPFLYEEMRLTAEIEDRVRANIQALVAFTAEVEKHCLPRGRVLWSESDDNLARKLIARLQQVQ